ncbi:30S ribosomal protein S15 [Candidatus Bathyarchaeota archaeon]|nr:30S ribosomal protein S15 [Candidatus Bathyarchaeota archaeon]
MARLHTHRRGKSSSTRPAIKSVPEWVMYTPREVEELVVQLGREGYPPAMIGLILRDSYGIPLVKTITGEKITQILKKNGLGPDPLPEDLTNLIKKALNLRDHLEDNKKDLHGKRGLQNLESKVYRLIRYYKKEGVLAPDFRYKPDKMRGLVSK